MSCKRDIIKEMSMDKNDLYGRQCSSHNRCVLSSGKGIAGAVRMKNVQKNWTARLGKHKDNGCEELEYEELHSIHPTMRFSRSMYNHVMNHTCNIIILPVKQTQTPVQRIPGRYIDHWKCCTSDQRCYYAS